MLKAPVSFHPQYGAYLVFRFDEVRRVFGDPDTFSSAVYDGLSEELAFSDQIQGMDPPRHTQLRALAAHAFTRRSVAELEPRIRQTAHDLLDQVKDREEFDFVRGFAIPLPIAVISDMLGVPKEDYDTFKEWSDLITEMSERLLTGLPDDPKHVEAIREMRAYFQRLLEERRANPREDLVSQLAAAEIDGRRLTPLEASNFCLLLLVAGNETTTNLLVNAVRTFAEHPEQWELLRSSPDLIPKAVEEVMRYRTSVQLMYRVVKKEVELGGAQMKPGDRVVVFMGAANRDPAKYDRPDVFDITRTPSPHLTFGHGIHQCLGAPLARIEVAAALEAMASRISKLQIPDEAELVPLNNFNMLGLQKLPLVLA
ncbi:cytochrome P450 [Paenibacillus flagellatus]|uniref:Cytochrome P450 n=2 Tax=Paenibacillus flagellatus TaxID=2211139 RepID=A0A2V5K1Q9_9BACL|nr:cytochrome P450 [Paenibacillus flagellatus]